MKTKTVRFFRSMILSILFCLTVLSLPLSLSTWAVVWCRVHLWSGMLLLLGAAVHLADHRRWIKSVFTRAAWRLAPRVRRRRRTNLGLLITSSLCTLAGVAWLLPVLPPEVTSRLERAHTITGIAMILFLGMHLLQHWGWLVNTIRSLNAAPGKHPEEITASSD